MYIYEFKFSIDICTCVLLTQPSDIVNHEEICIMLETLYTAGKDLTTNENIFWQREAALKIENHLCSHASVCLPFQSSFLLIFL